MANRVIASTEKEVIKFISQPSNKRNKRTFSPPKTSPPINLNDYKRWLI